MQIFTAQFFSGSAETQLR